MSMAEADFMAGLLQGLDASFSTSSPPAPLASSPHVSPAKSCSNDATSPIIDLTERPAASSSYHPRTPTKKVSPANLPQGVLGDVDMDELFAGAEDWDLEDYIPSPKKPSAKAIVPEPIGQAYEPEPYSRCVVDSVSEINRDGRWFKQLDVHVDRNLQDKRIILLQDDWYDTDVRPSDIVNAIGPFTPTSPNPTITISSQTNLLILHPDILLTATALSNAPQCSRKPLLSSLVRASNDVTPALVWGNMLHEVMQNCLLEKRWEEDWINEQIDSVLLSGLGMLLALNVSVETARSELRRRAIGLGIFKSRYISQTPKPDAVLSDTRSRAADAEALLAIPQLHEIEEDIWSPKYGLKGKIDATVETIISEKPPIVSKSDVMNNYLSRSGSSYNSTPATSNLPLSANILTSGPRPFEIKTGRSLAALEHRAQTMLYTLLTSERYGTDVPDGLLYYTQSDTVVRVPRSRNELRGLMVARNELAGYMIRRVGREGEIRHRRQEENKQEGGDIEEIRMNAETFLPPPIDSEHACKRCYTIDTCMLYRYAYSATSSTSKLPILESPPSFSESPSSLYDTYQLKTGHLTPEQGLFFRKWETLLSLEERDLVRFRRELWTIGAEDRQKKGRCFAGMVIQPSGLEEDEYANDAKNMAGSSTAGEGKEYKFYYTFVRSQASMVLPRGSDSSEVGRRNLLNGHMNVGDPITLSVEPHLLAFAQGYITHLSPDKVRLGVDHRVDLGWIKARLRKDKALAVQGAEEVVFRIDKDELFGGMGRMRNNLAQLFYVNGDRKRLELVVDLRKPEFSTCIPSAILDEPSSSQHTAHLNQSQKEAVSKVLSAEDYALILGMPGTGKTTVIAALIKILVEQGKTVLLTSYTHSAVDTILRKLDEGSGEGGLGFGLLRLGNADKVHVDVRKYTLGARKKAGTVGELEAQWMGPPVVAATCLSVDHPLFNRRKFDYCIVDEASQITLPTCLGPLRFADKFVLVGDHFQLPPLVKNPLARRGGLDVSLFRRLSDAHPESVVDLKEQYRMNGDIMALSNRLIYGDRLRCGSEEVAGRRLVLPNASIEGKGKRDWLEVCHRRQKRAGGDLPVAPCPGIQSGGGGGGKDACWLSYLSLPNTTAVFVDTDTLGMGVAYDSRVGDLVQNEVEADLVVQLVGALVGKWGVDKKDVGVISLYRQQVKLIKSLLAERRGVVEADREEDVEVLTADKSQGRDKECIVVSMVRSNEECKVGDLVKDWRRMNVSFTRARSKLVIFGSRRTLKADPLLSQFFELMEGRGWVYELPVGAHLVHKEDVGVGMLGEEDEGENDEDEEFEMENLTLCGDVEEMDATMVQVIPEDEVAEKLCEDIDAEEDVDDCMEEMDPTLVVTTLKEENPKTSRKLDDDVEIVDGFYDKAQSSHHSKSSLSSSKPMGQGKRKRMVVDIEEDEDIMIVDAQPASVSFKKKSGVVKQPEPESSASSATLSSSTAKSKSANGSSKRTANGKENAAKGAKQGGGPLDKYFFTAAKRDVALEEEVRPKKKAKVLAPTAMKKVATTGKAKSKSKLKEREKEAMEKRAAGLLKGRPILKELVASDQ